MKIDKSFFPDPLFSVDNIMCAAIAKQVDPEIDIDMKRIFSEEKSEDQLMCSLLLADTWKHIFPDEDSYNKFKQIYIIPIENTENWHSSVIDPLSSLISNMEIPWDSEEDYDDFEKAVNLVSEIIHNFVEQEKSKIHLPNLLKDAIEHSKNDIAILDQWCPKGKEWEDAFCDSSIKFVICPQKPLYLLNTVLTKDGIPKIPFPQEWQRKYWKGKSGSPEFSEFVWKRPAGIRLGTQDLVPFDTEEQAFSAATELVKNHELDQFIHNVIGDIAADAKPPESVLDNILKEVSSKNEEKNNSVPKKDINIKSMNQFIITEKTMEHNHHTLYQIQATEDFVVHGRPVKAGELGGWIENISNIGSHSWIAENAKVYGQSQIMDSYIEDEADIHDCCIVNSVISGSPEIENSEIVESNIKDQAKIRNSYIRSSSIEQCAVLTDTRAYFSRFSDEVDVKGAFAYRSCMVGRAKYIEEEPSKNFRKYEMTDETKIYNGKILHQICAKKDFRIGNQEIKKGDLGGWIEKEKNLLHFDHGWIAKDAIVMGDAVVHNSIITDQAVISGSAFVEGSSVSGEAHILNNSIVTASAVYDQTVISGFSDIENCGIRDQAQVSGYAKCENSTLERDAYISGRAEVKDSVIAYAKIREEAKIDHVSIADPVSITKFEKFQNCCRILDKEKETKYYPLSLDHSGEREQPIFDQPIPEEMILLSDRYNDVPVMTAKEGFLLNKEKEMNEWNQEEI